MTGQLIAAGCTSLIIFQMLVNICGVIGIMSARDARERRERHNRAPVGRVVARVLIVVGVLAAAALIAYAVLRNSPTFAITSIETEATEHVSVSDIQNLVNVESGTTLLNVDTSAITASLEKNPWIASVSYVRDFPGTLKITVTERKVYALVTMSDDYPIAVEEGSTIVRLGRTVFDPNYVIQ